MNQQLVEVGQLRDVRQLALEQQVRGLFKRRELGQLVDVIAAIDQLPEVTIHVADRGVGCDDSFESFRSNLVGRVIFVQNGFGGHEVFSQIKRTKIQAGAECKRAGPTSVETLTVGDNHVATPLFSSAKSAAFDVGAGVYPVAPRLQRSGPRGENISLSGPRRNFLRPAMPVCGSHGLRRIRRVKPTAPLSTFLRNFSREENFFER